ncbi:hypothetical protein [Rhizobium sp. MHM7A]|uniref:hypothetical protein n=1 Tax=Rhizobium sp. MHM7A TaxID=2583233 RepID=UPI0011075CAD|nr:hypothetical protein [Rhizobium sp. MHM7A]TLX12113.1 hypothetical protein FFR93_16220 [Rhizobium sp. MHM7A]
MNTVEEALQEIFRTALRVPLGDAGQEEAMFDAIDRLPAHHAIHRVTSMAFQCGGCGHAGFIRDTVFNLETGEAGCPKCGRDGTLHLLKGGVA